MWQIIFVEPVRAATNADEVPGRIGNTFITDALLLAICASDPAAEAALAQQVRDEAARLGLVPT